MREWENLIKVLKVGINYYEPTTTEGIALFTIFQKYNFLIAEFAYFQNMGEFRVNGVGLIIGKER